MDLLEPGSDLGLSGRLQNPRSLGEKATGREGQRGAVRDSGDSSCGPRRGKLPPGGQGVGPPLLTLRLPDGFCCQNLGSVSTDAKELRRLCLWRK